MTSTVPPGSMRLRNDSPWWRGTTPTCRGIGPPSSSCRWRSPPRRRGVARLVAAGEPWTVEASADVSVGQPQWQRDGSLRFVSDRHGWWQPHTHSGRPDGRPAIASTTTAAEFHGPDWALGQCTMAELADGSLVARRTSEGRDSIVRIVAAGQPPPLVSQPCVTIAGLCVHKDGIAFIGAPPDGPATVWTLGSLAGAGGGGAAGADGGAGGGAAGDSTARPPHAATAVRPSPPTPLSRGDISVGEAFSLVGRSGRPVHGLFYEPVLEGTTGPPAALPPLLVQCHGGPTGSVQAGYDVVVQYFTSRGFAVAAVDYAGSAGYGRAYRLSLWGQWGVADNEDCADAARHLGAIGRVDGSAMAIRGSSAAGLTALNALASGSFAAAASWYGVTDLLALPRPRTISRRTTRIGWWGLCPSAGTAMRSGLRPSGWGSSRVRSFCSRVWTTSSSRRARPRDCETRWWRTDVTARSGFSKGRATGFAEPRPSGRPWRRSWAFTGGYSSARAGLHRTSEREGQDSIELRSICGPAGSAM